MTFSGDKLLGGPQSGLIAGTESAVGQCRRHPLFRALRPDRLTYMALEATLQVYRAGEEAAIAGIPALARLLAPLPELKQRAERLAERFGKDPIAEHLEIQVVADNSQAGSGSLPTRELPTYCVHLRSPKRPTTDLARQLRVGTPSVLTRVRDDALLFDVRTLLDSEFEEIAERVAQLDLCGEPKA